MEKKTSMTWTVFAIGAALSWGFYGAMLHKGQVALASPVKAMLCVGLAYFLIGVLAPLGMLASQGGIGKFSGSGATWATIAGALGAIGAVFIIYAFRAGGSPVYVMPLVFAGAPMINVAASLMLEPPKEAPGPMLYLGFVLAAVGTWMVLHFKPQ
jgi:drug/metabolite transporter (DMT)-like permease